jgi:hypothetical protein
MKHGIAHSLLPNHKIRMCVQMGEINTIHRIEKIHCLFGVDDNIHSRLFNSVSPPVLVA